MNAAAQKVEHSVIKSLLAWYNQHGRHDLPWRKTRDPYKVLVSELMLQQTQVPRVIPKYEAFVKKFPTIAALAAADRQEVLTLWQGLGYNNRAVRLHALANVIARERNGRFPANYDELRALPGIGPYTAGAVMNFAYNKPAPCVDVNIQRVLARLFWTPRQTVDKDALASLALQLTEESGAAHDWNSALMDFGSAVCTARNPSCTSCPLRSACKSKGARNDETNASKRQSAFHGSRRWWRGQILKSLLAAPVKEAHLLHRIKAQPTAEDHDLYDDALAMMLSEGLAERKGQMLRLRK